MGCQMIVVTIKVSPLIREEIQGLTVVDIRMSSFESICCGSIILSLV